jgi:hypothetical protein
VNPVQIEGLAPIIANLTRLEGRGGLAPADKPLQSFTRRMVKAMGKEPYPPELPNQKYVRTGLLAASFKEQRVQLAKYMLENTAPGRGWAIAKPQAQIHKGRWWTMMELVERDMGDLIDGLGEAYVKAIVNG